VITPDGNGENDTWIVDHNRNVAMHNPAAAFPEYDGTVEPGNFSIYNGNVSVGDRNIAVDDLDTALKTDTYCYRATECSAYRQECFVQR
jgi:hypothetical protein